MLRPSNHEARFLRTSGVTVLVGGIYRGLGQLHRNHLPALRGMADVLELNDVRVHGGEVKHEVFNLIERVVEVVIGGVRRRADVPNSVEEVVVAKQRVLYVLLPCLWDGSTLADAVGLRVGDVRRSVAWSWR